MEDKRLNVNIGSLKLKNPVMTASGTFGFGEEYSDFIDVSRLGGIVVKGTTGERREGNAYPRLAEIPAGMINAVGLQNKGVEYFCNNIYPRIKGINENTIVNVSGSSIDEYCKVASMVNDLEDIPAIELNISCPNVKKGGMGFGVNKDMAFEVVSEVRKVYKKHLIVKLTPNVTNIVEIAQAVEKAGADSVSLINTLLAMAVDAERQKPIISTITGGMSGPAVKPVALRCVWQVSHNVDIPVIGMGGIQNATDAIEFLLVGASAVEVGTANFLNPKVTMEIIDGLSDYLDRHHIDNIKDIIGKI
ncbi:MAG: dihydroorotate dehydrogenase [Bacteroidales bacterium]|nr:dihydroorotate dehydrogenase [Candidatus Scybalousia scybalohippi]